MQVSPVRYRLERPSPFLGYADSPLIPQSVVISFAFNPLKALRFSEITPTLYEGVPMKFLRVLLFLFVFGALAMAAEPTSFTLEQVLSVPYESLEADVYLYFS